MLNWIKSDISDTLYQVRIDGVLPDDAPGLNGVPQGSVIGQLLLLLYITDPPDALGGSDWFCRRLENGVPAISIKPSSRLSFWKLFKQLTLRRERHS